MDYKKVKKIKNITLNILIKVLFNMIRMILLYIFSFGRIKCQILQLISLSTSLKVKGKKANIKVDSWFFTARSVTILANGGEISIGRDVFINNHCTIVSHNRISIDSNTTIGPNVCIFDHDHNYKKVSSTEEDYVSSPISIGKNVWIGANVVLLQGTIIGDNCVIGAGTVIKGEIPSNQIVIDKKNLIIRNK